MIKKIKLKRQQTQLTKFNRTARYMIVTSYITNDINTYKCIAISSNKKEKAI